jgi:hypothetical protein
MNNIETPALLDNFYKDKDGTIFFCYSLKHIDNQLKIKLFKAWDVIKSSIDYLTFQEYTFNLKDSKWEFEQANLADICEFNFTHMKYTPAFFDFVKELFGEFIELVSP